MASYLDKTGLTTLWSKMKSHVSSNYLSLQGGAVTGNISATSYSGSWSGNTIPISKGGTGATSAAGARSALGITPANIGAPTKTGSGASGTWGINITGDAATSEYLYGWADTRNAATTPNDYNASFKIVGIKSTSVTGTLDNSAYSTLIGVRGWTESSGGHAHEFALTGSGNLYRRTGSTTSWGGWFNLLDSGNYMNYALPISGGTLTGPLTASTVNVQNTSHAPLTVSRSGSTYYASIKFANSLGTLGYIGMTAVNGSLVRLCTDTAENYKIPEVRGWDGSTLTLGTT